MRIVIDSLLAVFFPHLCVVCEDRLVDGEKHICLKCLTKLPLTEYAEMPDNWLEQFFAGRIPFRRAAAYAYFEKEGSLQRIVHEFKYKNNSDLAYFVGCLCGDELKDSSLIRGIDYIIPVPLHHKRKKERGYNQSEQIAKGISEQTGITLLTGVLLREINNPSQTKNSRFARWENVADIFSVKNREILEGKHILLIDDVITTGSTLESCAKEILKCSDCKISIYALASVE